MDSPFASILGEHQANLPAAFREQYLCSADAPGSVILSGTMDRVWHRPAWLWPALWLSTWFDLLFPETGTHVPAVMRISGGRDRSGQPYHRWERTFHFQAQRRFNATMRFDARESRVVEWLGPFDMAEIVWRVVFKPPTVIEIATERCNLRLGHARIALPRYAYPSVTAIETAVNDATIHIALEATHPLLGAFFGYSGHFGVRRQGAGPPRP